MATCETHGHLWGHDGKCVMCKEPKPASPPTEERVSDDRLQELIDVYDGQAFRGDFVLALQELQRLRHYVATCGGTDNDGRCPMHHLAGVSPEPRGKEPPHCPSCNCGEHILGEPVAVSPAAALDALKAAMLKDHAFAWTWHCGLAMSIKDNLGANHGDANRAAAAFMRLAFEVDTSRQPEANAAKPAPTVEPAERLTLCLQSIMADLADLLDADQFNNIEARVLAAGVPYPPLGTDPRTTLTKAEVRPPFCGYCGDAGTVPNNSPGAPDLPCPRCSLNGGAK